MTRGKNGKPLNETSSRVCVCNSVKHLNYTSSHLKAQLTQGSKNPRFEKSPTQWAFLGFIGVFWTSTKKIGKII